MYVCVVLACQAWRVRDSRESFFCYLPPFLPLISPFPPRHTGKKTFVRGQKYVRQSTAAAVAVGLLLLLLPHEITFFCVCVYVCVQVVFFSKILFPFPHPSLICEFFFKSMRESGSRGKKLPSSKLN